ncbi:hypothetical protein AMAG_07895 [Allomyces macrogynus ATCC 38327]|uniref:Uncharacterized protein n=1 Tax=Allomyces macrogynus (strain ATCC 38327) TaxID=578462 RepID=A0A0L0SJW5_ALLM3|nr:hypothetical protein AMAG_07895 [Allomyces macrogynus ATCC 38327]|eukprot:KNE62705.1 hypothetical protein AMAG_07895 [Allomyces macrogynus ATCC 38327]
MVHSASPNQCQARTVLAMIKSILLLILVALTALTHAAWPQNMQRKAFISPGLAYLPKENKTFVFGGKVRIRKGVAELIPDVAIIDLNQLVTANNISCAAVSAAPFSLLFPAYRLPTFVVDNGNGVYEAWLFAMGDEKSPSRAIWRVPDLLSPKAAIVSAPPAKGSVPEIYFPCWASASSPSRPSDAAAYFFGNMSADGAERAQAGNDTLWRFDREGIAPVPPATSDKPSSRGWATMIQYGPTVMLMGGTGSGADIWTFNKVSSTWQQRTSNLAAGRFDLASVLYETPDRKRRYAIVVGGASNAKFIEYFDVDAQSKAPVSEVISGTDGPASIAGSQAMFLHDSHLFLVGGLGESDDSASGMLLTIVRVNPTSDGSALSFTYVPAYTPDAIRMAATNGGNSTGTDGRDENGEAKTLTAGAIAGIAVGVGVVLLAAGVFVLIRHRRRQDRGKSTMARPERESPVMGGSALYEPAGSEVGWPNSPAQQQQRAVTTLTPFDSGLTLLLPPAEAESPPMQLQGGSQIQVPAIAHDAHVQGAQYSSPYVLAQTHPMPFAQGQPMQFVQGQPMFAQGPPVFAHGPPTAATRLSQEQRPILSTAGPGQRKEN